MLNQQPKRKPYRNKKLLAACHDPDLTCQVQLPGCQGPGAPTMPAHSNCSDDGKGGSQKADDLYVAISCQHCHDILDGRKGGYRRIGHIRTNAPYGVDTVTERLSGSELQWYHDRAIKRSLRILLVDMGIKL